MAIIDLASGPLNCAQAVICLDRSISEEDSKSLFKSLNWVGFELVTLDVWMKPHGATSRVKSIAEMHETSDKWLFLGMEL